VTVDVQLDGQEQSLSLGELEARIRDGSLGADVPVRIAAITGDRWVAACTLQIWTSVADSPEARFQRSWARPATPWMTALVVGGSVRVFAWLWGTLPGMKVSDAWARSTPSILELGQSWRLYTYGFLHAGPAHLLMNMLFLGFIGLALETLLGAESIAALYLFAVVGGGTMSTFFSPGSASVARPSLSEVASLTNRMGCHGGESRPNAPGRVCQANTSSIGASTTLENSSPTGFSSCRIGTFGPGGRRRQRSGRARSTMGSRGCG
jgi:hypothetical protein